MPRSSSARAFQKPGSLSKSESALGMTREHKSSRSAAGVAAMRAPRHDRGNRGLRHFSRWTKKAIQNLNKAASASRANEA